MNAHDTTASDLAAALMGKPRVGQSVVVSSSVHSGSPLGPRHVVLVTPEGSDRGEYYECGDRALALLRNGMSPEDLELEPIEGDDEAPEYPAWDREASRGDRIYQERMEGVRP